MGGTTLEEEKVMLAQPLPDYTELIGVWLDEGYDPA